MTHTETQATVEMLERRERCARKAHQSVYADDLASVLALLTRQQEEIERLTREAVKYEIGEGSHKVYVEKRSEALWCITRDGSSVLNTDGEWEYEPTPSGRDGDFIARTRYLRNTALNIARAALQAKP